MSIEAKLHTQINRDRKIKVAGILLAAGSLLGIISSAIEADKLEQQSTAAKPVTQYEQKDMNTPNECLIGITSLFMLEIGAGLAWTGYTGEKSDELQLFIEKSSLEET